MPDTINVAQLARLVGTHAAPVIIDVRIDNDHASDPRMLPASVRRDYRTVSSWAEEYASRSIVVICQRGQKLSQGVAAWLRHAGARAEYLEGGFEARAQGKGMLVRPDHVPERDSQGRTVWVTRARPIREPTGSGDNTVGAGRPPLQQGRRVPTCRHTNAGQTPRRITLRF